MSKIRTFSSNENWKCLNQLMDKLPRSIDISCAIRTAIEMYSESIDNRPSISLDNFETEITTPELLMSRNIWEKLLNSMNMEDIRDLKELMKKRMSLVDDQIYERTL